jgi:CRISPR system Cascade subunit CasE
MLYLSQLVLNGASRDVRRDLADCAALHSRILSAFPDDPTITCARDHFGVLYRVEPASGDARILVQSRHHPDWSRLPADYLRMPATDPKPLDPLYAHIVPGQELIFRLRANPTRRISSRNTEQGERWRGKRVDLRREEDQIAWLARKGLRSGFTLLSVRAPADVSDVRVGLSNTLNGHKPAGGRLAFGSVVFEGRLRVTDAGAFREALEGGIGSGKAFGFGLLSIAPVRGEADE